MTEKNLFLVGRIGGEAKEVAIKGVSTKDGKEVLPVDSGAFGTLITLREGENGIVLSAGKLQQTVKVYYLPAKSVGKDGKGPSGYKRFYVHANPSALSCEDCHKKRRGKFDFKKITPAQANCTTSNCHNNMGKAAHVHGPVGAGVCISCHSPHGSYLPKSMERSGQELCLVCHQGKREEFNESVVHAPVKEGCTDCHNPHESPMRFQLRGNGASVSSLCFNCHEAAIFTKAHRHGPVGAGDCIACHRPHAGKFKKLLIAPPENGQVCFQCHQDRKDEFSMKYVHQPVTQDCNQCHDPHSSEARYQLHKPGGALCASCHKKLSPGVYQDIETATYKHEPVDQGRCTDCHRAHSSNVKPLLKNTTEALCFSCHDELSDQVTGSKNRHGPVQTGDCAACHKVHGSKNTRMLVRYYPEEFYKDYSPENYDLCFGCHNKEIAKKKFTNTLTNFRDGEYNLHYFHVNMKKGRNCVACHDAHASNQAKHIRYEVPFGAWSYPISLTKKETGGTCVVGCHAPKSYDRINPKNKPSR
ncbi:cytochrome c3 family protein [Thiovibrio sp. JS02]